MRPLTIRLLFFALMLGIPLAQAGWELARGERVQALDVLGPIEESRLRSFEDELRRASFVHQRVTPRYQELLLRVLGRGNERSIYARGSYHYRDDLEYLIAPPFDPAPSLRAIADLEEQLANAGIDLLLVPVPPKASAQGARFSAATADLEWIDNGGAEAWYAALEQAGIDVLRVDELARGSGLGAEFFLSFDTHWSPTGMQVVADALADRLRAKLEIERVHLFPTAEPAQALRGDLLRMLRLPEGSDLVFPSHLRVPMVPLRFGEFDRASPVLLLGDSWTRAYSDPDLGLGGAAGFAERIGQLLRVPLDRIAQAGEGARGVREALARRASLLPSEGGLAGKRVVVWQFSMRDLIHADERWEPIDLGIGEAENSVAFNAPQQHEIWADIVETSAVRAGFDYPFALGLFEYRPVDPDGVSELGERFWVAQVIVRDSAPAPASRLRVGQRLRLVLEPVEAHHDLEQTTWVDDTDAPVRADLWYAVETELIR